ncbi:MAG: 2-C-methyl-D-erythritol 2,4-cyclodiphosphate synthase [Bacteroidetes bacterium]|nr:2-C-methyl-D-erythritol 2,4-cyclodiphosphate synthase [Bacteroidota bacterium]MBU1113684.1 2-C-methyl-D-erythritol 2,4-cyclodiphosphate synthase [Bacteroidota bacterium]MBU1799097.1 2-C-methyl-D-erythritol 2,4-cyclodiphosphate synthase [Bacteroidota bacterium]
MKLDYRIGFGYDVHQFADDRKFMLGGIEIPFERGLKGHSDADALLHSICDAMLGSLALGDIGKHFPDTDPKYKGISSKILLTEVNNLVESEGYKLGNLDSTIVLQRPKIATHIESIRKMIASILFCDINQISVKATTSEWMGFVGEEKGIKVISTVIMVKK